MKKLGLVFIIGLLISCSEKKHENPPPQSLISIEEFAGIMSDLYLAEAFGINDRAHSFKNTKDQVYPYYKEVMDKHNVSKIDFDSAYGYYQNHPKIMLKVLDKARLNLEDLKKKTLEEKPE